MQEIENILASLVVLIEEAQLVQQCAHIQTIDAPGLFAASLDIVMSSPA